MRSKWAAMGMAGITLFVLVMFIVREQRDISLFENRTMATFPAFSVNAFMEGEFQDQLEEALKDQIVSRDQLIRWTSNLKGATKKYYNLAYDFFVKRDNRVAYTDQTPFLPGMTDSPTGEPAMPPASEPSSVPNPTSGMPTNDPGAHLPEPSFMATPDGSDPSVNSSSRISPTPAPLESPASPVSSAGSPESTATPEVPMTPVTPTPWSSTPSPTVTLPFITPTVTPRDIAIPLPSPSQTTSGPLPTIPLPSQTPVGTSTPTPSPSRTPMPSISPSSLPTPRTSLPPVQTPKPDLHYALEPAGEMYRIKGTDYLVEYPLIEKTASKHAIDNKAYQIGEMLKRHPHLKVYAYYVTKAQNLNWFDRSENLTSFDYIGYLASNLPNEVRFDYLKFVDLDDYMAKSFKTDHHWNYQGSYQGYIDIYRMMSRDFNLSPLKEPVGVLDFSEFGGAKFIGSYGGKSGGTRNEPDDFVAYEFDLGEYESYYGDEVKDLGMMNEYKQGNFKKELTTDHYTQYYGGFESQALIRHVFEGNDLNLLFIGDSNNRAIRRVIASHFHTTLFVEYRYLEKTDLDQLIKDYNIDCVLIMGQDRYWQDNRYVFKNYPKLN